MDELIICIFVCKIRKTLYSLYLKMTRKGENVTMLDMSVEYS